MLIFGFQIFLLFKETKFYLNLAKVKENLTEPEKGLVWDMLGN
jgi:hypothetical protein